MTVLTFPRIWDVLIEPRDASGNTVEFLYSNHARYERIHHGIDEPDSFEYVEGRVRNPGTIGRAMFGSNRLSGPMDIATVQIELENGDGGLDFLRSYAFDGCAIFVSMVQEVDNGIGGPASDSDEGFSLVGEQALFNEDVVTIVARDYRHSLDRPLLFKRYAGTNAGSPLAGIEGTANDLKGSAKPLLLGTAFNVTPNLVNTDRRIYQVDGVYPDTSDPFFGDPHAGGLFTGYTITVYDKRSALTRGADYASQADMETNVPAAGQYRVWPAGACFRLGSAPVGRVTCDVTNPPYAGDANSLHGICKRLVRLVDGGFFSSEYDAPWAANPQAGIYLNDSGVSILSALEQALGSVGAFVTDEDSTIQADTFSLSPPYFFQLNAPESLPYTPFFEPFEFDRSNIVPGTLQQLAIPGIARGAPVWRVNVNYKRNYTVMSDADLAGVAAADAEFCKKEWRTVTAENTAVLTQWPEAIELTVNTLLVVQSEAQAEANRLLAIFGVPREMYRCVVEGHAIRHQQQFMSGGSSDYESGNFTYTSLVKVTYPRFGMDAGRTFVVVASTVDLAADKYDVIFWG